MTGERDVDPPPGEAPVTPADAAAALVALSVRLKEQAASLRHDIQRLRQALTDIDSAMSASLDRLNDARERNALLQSILEVPPGEPVIADAVAAAPAAPGVADIATADPVPPPLALEKRSGGERRGGDDRRRDPSELTGLLRWLEGSTLDRRSGGDRRSGEDRRAPRAVKATMQRSRPTKTDKLRPAATVISIAEVRAARRPPKPPEG